MHRAGHCCERCGRSRLGTILQVHHKTYARLGNEHLDDLKVVCIDCHQIEDDARRAKKQKELELKIYNSQLQEWATNTYGHNWEDSKDYDDIAEAFDNWLSYH